jgi:hypothetical protein
VVEIGIATSGNQSTGAGMRNIRNGNYAGMTYVAATHVAA